MSLTQRMLLFLLPRRWGENMRTSSEQWRIRCLKCGASRSVWEAGGVRWAARSRGKRTVIRCRRCGRWSCAAVERISDAQ